MIRYVPYIGEFFIFCISNNMMQSWNGNTFCITVPLWGESTGASYQRIPPQRGSHVKLWCFLWYQPEQAVEQTVRLLVAWDTMMLTGHHCNEEETVLPLYWKRQVSLLHMIWYMICYISTANLQEIWYLWYMYMAVRCEGTFTCNR